MESLSDDMYTVKNLRRNMDILNVALFGRYLFEQKTHGNDSMSKSSNLEDFSDKSRIRSIQAEDLEKQLQSK